MLSHTHKTQKFHLKNYSVLKSAWNVDENCMKITGCPVLGGFAVEHQFQSDPCIYTGDLLFISGSFQSSNFIFNNFRFPCNIFWGFILQSMGLINLGMFTFSHEGVKSQPWEFGHMPIIQKLHEPTAPEWKELTNLNRKLESLPCTECHQGSV